MFAPKRLYPVFTLSRGIYLLRAVALSVDDAIRLCEDGDHYIECRPNVEIREDTEPQYP